MAKAAEVAKRNSTGVVTVACNLPNGIRLRVDEMVTETEMIINGTREVKRAQQIGDWVTLNGTRTPFGIAPSYQVLGGFALTPNVSAEFWEAWLQANANSALVKNGCIFAYEKRDDMRDAVKAHKGVKSGLEPLDMSDPKKADTRAPKGVKQGDRGEGKDQGADADDELELA